MYTLVSLFLMLSGCVTPADPPSEETECGDAVDNDEDGLIDCADTDCLGAASCEQADADTDADTDSDTDADTDTDTDADTDTGLPTAEEYLERALNESCRIFVICDYYDTVQACIDATPEPATDFCEYQPDVGAECLAELEATLACPQVFPALCGDVWVCDSGR